MLLSTLKERYVFTKIMPLLWLNRTCKLCNRRERFSSYQRVIDLVNSDGVTNKTTIKGWVRSLRKMKENIFIDVDDGSSVKRLQIVAGKALAEQLDYGCSIEAKGNLVQTPRGQIEMHADEIKLIGLGNLQDGYPFAPRKSYNNEYYRQYLHLRPRLSHYASLFRIRNAMCIAIREFFNRRNYIEIHTPILTSNDCEGAGEVFKIVADNPGIEEPFFGETSFLTVSSQFHLEIMARSLSQVYCFSPTFRAENSKSRFHLSEFYMLEGETAMISVQDELIKLVEDLVRYTVDATLKSNEEDVTHCRKSGAKSNFKLEDCLKAKSFIIVSYKEASDILLKHNSSLKVEHKPGTSLTKEHELFLTTYTNGVPIFVVDWPAKLKSFYMRINKDKPENVEAFDLLFPNVGEICGGSLREDDLVRLNSVLGEHKGLEWYADLRKYGNVLTGGFGLGFDRLLMALLNVDNIKDTVPFPRYPHHCQL